MSQVIIYAQYRKSLIFYGVAISSVVTLFSVVSRYGTARLQAPTAIAGNYQLQVEPSELCSEPPALPLRIQQSGIFVTHDGDSFSGQITFAGLPAPLMFNSQFLPAQTSASSASH